MLEDVQSRADERGVVLDHAGIAGLKHPITLATGAAAPQSVLASFAMSVRLPAHVKGTHMSRFVETLGELAGPVTLRTLCTLEEAVRRRLEAERARVELEATFVLLRRAPVSGAPGWIDYRVRMACDGPGQASLGVSVPVTSLCPCSKAISDYGAHNQRGIIHVDVWPRDASQAPSLEELVSVAEAAGSSPIYAVLKRADERAVTMRAYDHPMFVEDMARAVAVKLGADTRLAAFQARAVNDESIHNHQAFAEVRG